jgi:epoxyqueuosine reductase
MSYLLIYGRPQCSVEWLDALMKACGVELWGEADLRDFHTPKDETGKSFPFAVSFVYPMNPRIMESIQKGPNKAYADEYTRVNQKINEISENLAAEIRKRGFSAKPLAASARTDTVNIKGDFPQKTAATQAGLGWIGRHCQLITRRFGSWIRLGTVFTDFELSFGKPVARNFCGHCMRCVEACPAKAIKGKAWHPGLTREEILDVHACDKWKKENYFQYHNGHNCGICSSVCPYGLKVLRKRQVLH